MITRIPDELKSHLLCIVKDLEETRDIYSGFSYARTIRNILVGKETAIIAPFFDKKEYYGYLDYISIKSVEQILDNLVAEKQLWFVYTEHGKLYCTKDYYETH